MSYLASYENMGSAVVTCNPSACECKPTTAQVSITLLMPEEVTFHAKNTACTITLQTTPGNEGKFKFYGHMSSEISPLLSAGSCRAHHTEKLSSVVLLQDEGCCHQGHL